MNKNTVHIWKWKSRE